MDPSFFYLLISLIALIFSGYYSGLETGLISANRIKLRYLSIQGNKNAKRLEKLLEQPKMFLSTVLVGNNIANIMFSSFFTIYLSHYMDEWAIPLITTSVILIGGEIIPKSLYREFAQFLSLKSIRGLTLSYHIFYPFIVLTTYTSNILLRFFKTAPLSNDYYYSRQGLRKLIDEGQKTGVVEPEEQEIISKVFSIKDTTVQQIMTLKEKIVSISKDASVEELKQIIIDSGYTRIPVYEKNKDNIIGLIHAFDVLFRGNEIKQIKDIILPIYYIYNDKSCGHLLREFKSLKSQLAVVMNRKRTIQGIISMEDLLEHLVGEIYDEYDQP